MTDYGVKPATSGVTPSKLAVAAFFITPCAVCMIGVALFSGREGYSDQSTGPLLLYYGFMATLPATLYWGSFSVRTDGRGRPLRSIWWAWAIAVVGYCAIILVTLLFIWLNSDLKPLTWEPRR
jgi:hypothetical protein